MKTEKEQKEIMIYKEYIKEYQIIMKIVLNKWKN